MEGVAPRYRQPGPCYEMAHLFYEDDHESDRFAMTTKIFKPIDLQTNRHPKLIKRRAAKSEFKFHRHIDIELQFSFRHPPKNYLLSRPLLLLHLHYKRL
jgi:hypothetical protein